MAAMTRAFRFDLAKGVQCAGVVLRDYGPMERLRLLKILYVANRRKLAETGIPLLGGRLSALDHGPLHSEVYDAIKGHGDDAAWNAAFENVGQRVRQRDGVAVPRDRLSPYEVDLLNEVRDWAEGFSVWDLSDYTHEFAEWQANRPPAKSSRPIHVEELLEAVGMTAEEAEGIVSDQAASERFDALMGIGG